MQNKKLVAVAVALAMQTYYVPAIAADNNDDDKDCPANISLLSKEERSKLSATCLATLNEKDNHWGWVAGTAAALVAGIAIGNHDSGGSDHHSSSPVPPDEGGGDVTPPDDGGGDVTPPDDGGDETPTDKTVKTFSNDVTLDKGQKALRFDDIKLDNGEHLGAATLNYSEKDDQWQLTTESGKVLRVSGWNVTDANAAVIEGTQGDSGLYWKYDSKGNLILADKNTKVATGDGKTNASERGMAINGQNTTGVIISGDGTTNTLSGGSTVSDDATGLVITGDNTHNIISGQSSVTDGAIGALISGDGSITDISGGIDVSGGGTGLVIDGDAITINNDGISNISGNGSTGSVINGDDATVTNSGEMNVTDGATGGKITGDNATINNKGDSSISGEGSVALIVDGDNTTITSEGKQTIADGGTATAITGDGATAAMTGDIDVSGGGTAMVIDGDNASVTIDGQSDISGSGSTGTVINGDRARITNDGELNVADGGTGAKITGDDAIVNNTGDITADGADSTALYIDGNNAQVVSEGDQTITGGAHGTRINGDNARISNTGDMTVDGAGSIAVIIDGNNSRMTQAGDLLVTDGAWGIVTHGQGNTLTNTGDATVRDEDSTGFVVAGTKNTLNNKGNINVSLNGTGALASGDEAQVTLDGNIHVTAEKDDSDVFRGATGVAISGNNTTTEIKGSVTLTSDFDSSSTMANSDTLTGVSITGNNNQLSLSGSLDIDVNDQSATDYIKLDSVGLSVTGTGNNVELKGGIDLTLHGHDSDENSAVTGIMVDGANTVTLSGDSRIDYSGIPGGPMTLADIKNGGTLVLDESSTIDVTYTGLSYRYVDLFALLLADGQGSTANNQGVINILGSATGIQAQNGAEVKNSGMIDHTINTAFNQSIDMVAKGEGSTARNTVGGHITIVSNQTPAGGGGANMYPQMWYFNTAYGMLAYGYGEVFNDAGASISVQGAGTYGMGASKGSALNAGDIYVDGFQQTLDADGNITGETFWNTSHHELPSAGMVAGSSNSGSGDAVAVNTGTITVHNAGYGMTAMSGGTAINQGTITLTADSGINGEANQLVGMAAFMGGVVINDTTGTININADYGQAFYSDSSSYIINNGAINLNDSPMDDADPHMGTAPTDKAWLQALAGSGDSITRTSDTGFFTTETLANYGTVMLNGDVDVNGWLYNEPGATLTVNGNLDMTVSNGSIENHGTLNADTIATAHSLFNEADGSITTDLLTINGGSTFFNDGQFTGAIAGTSYQQNIVNTGSMTVAEDGKSLVSGSFRFYNQQGATLTNSGNATQGGENTLINITRANDSLSQVNSGTITATNGYSAITAVNGSNNPVWIWNTATGVINGINPDAPLINLGRGYSFGNEGTVNVQGDNAVAISGGTSSYTINLVNSGTINVGTEQGKADGTNGTGLIGIKGNGNATTINNAADGVINVYADSSYAFGGTTKAIINNGEINLLCDTGCGIYAPGTTGTQHTADGTADIAIPDAATAPTKGNIPAPPADPNAPQQLSNYIVGTNADGSSGTLKANNLVIGDNVKVGTEFTAGTADTTVVVDNAFTGSNIQGAENITSTSVVWNARGSTDSSGNVDVTMTKNAYTSVATDGSVNSVAQALDAGYTNNELYTSLNVGTTAELNNALKQVSGSQATTAFREARILSNRFNMLADAAPQVKDGLAFNVVAKGDPRAELGNDTQYDMLALRQTLDVTASQNLTLEYGIARIDGNGSQTAGDNGLTGGYSQFFGLKHSMTFDDGLAWNNALRYDAHDLDSSRSVSYGDVSKVADSSARQQYMEFRSEGAKTFKLMDDALKVTPYAGVKFRHTMEDGYQERSAGDFNLSMNAGSETAVDSIVGMKLDYAGENGWSANMTLEGGPNLSYAKSQRTASLQGAAGQQFSVDDGQKGGGVNGLATVGVKYSTKDTSLNLDAYQWKEDDISDKGFMLNFRKTFR